MGVPPNQPFIDGFLPYKPSILGTIMEIAQCMSMLFYFNGKMFINQLWGT